MEYPKAARLREQREAKFNAEQVRLKAQDMLLRQCEKMTAKTVPTQAQQAEHRMTAIAISRKGKKK